VHELGADRAGVGRLEQGEQVAQLHAVVAADTASAELALEVRVREAVERQAQVRRLRLLQQAERVDVGPQVAARAVGGDQPADLALAFVAGAGRRSELAAGGQPARGGDRVDDRRMRDITRLATLEAIEIGFPFRLHAVGRNQVLLVQVLDVGGVRAELGGLGKLLEEAVHDGGRETLVGRSEARSARIARYSGSQDPEL